MRDPVAADVFELILYQPEIPPNAGNVMRLAANIGARLHLVRPLGFRLSDRALARAGMDYRSRIEIIQHDSWRECRAWLHDRRILAFSTRGSGRYDLFDYTPGDSLLFGPETRGLPGWLLDELPAQHRLRIPMRADSRSINLSNAVALVAYEAWRQAGFEGGE